MKFKNDKSQNAAWVEWLSDAMPGSDTEKTDVPLVAESRTVHDRSYRLPSRNSARAVPSPRVPWHAGVSSRVVARQPNITLNIQLPDMTGVVKKAKALPWRNISRTAAMLAGVSLIIYGGNAYVIKRRQAAEEATAIAAQTIPPYKPLTSTSSEGQADEAKYVANKQLYVFHDHFKDVDLTVSQQPMPQSSKTPQDKLADIAFSLGATEKLQTAIGSVYFTQPDSAGGQRAVFTNKQVLIVASSTVAMTPKDWATYSQSLK